MAGEIQLEVVTPEHRVIQEAVDEVILPGQEGYLGVRPGHTPLLTALTVGECCFVKGGTRHYAALRGGFAEVLPDRVSVLTEAAELAADIDLARAEDSRARAERILKEAKDSRDEEYRKASERLRRAMARISIATR